MLHIQILIYGFKPYRQFSENITEQIISGLPSRPNLVKKVFEVEFDFDMFENTLQACRPDVIIGLGQHPGARKLRIERKAKNRLCTDRGRESKIRRDGPESLIVNLSLPVINGFTRTYDAGTYVCNFSMYLMCEYVRENGGKFAFLHVPINTDTALVHNYLNGILNFD